MVRKRTPRLDALLDKVESLCRNKSALARELGVSRDHVHKWITARQYEPGGEITLRLQEWVRAEEAKHNKNRAGAITPTRQRTRSTNQTYESKTRKTSPRKR